MEKIYRPAKGKLKSEAFQMRFLRSLFKVTKASQQLKTPTACQSAWFVDKWKRPEYTANVLDGFV